MLGKMSNVDMRPHYLGEGAFQEKTEATITKAMRIMAVSIPVMPVWVLMIRLTYVRTTIPSLTNTWTLPIYP